MISTSILRAIKAATEQAVDMIDGQWSPRELPVGIWSGFARVGSPRGRVVLEELVAAGVTSITFTPVNRAESGRRWEWALARRDLVDGVVFAKSLGLRVGLGPWARCTPDFMKTTGEELARLGEDCGGVDFWELDAEGSFEATAKGRVRRTGQTYEQVVAEALGELVAHKPPEVELAATVLYFRRKASNALLASPLVDEGTIQAYSVFFPGSSAKAVATRSKVFQPGTLQRKAADNYNRFKESAKIKRLIMGLGWWAQDRSRAPGAIRLETSEGFRRASDACLQLAPSLDGVCGWAMHLWDSPTKAVERARLDFVLREIAYIARGGAAALDKADDIASDVVQIHADRQWIAAGRRIPSGYQKIDGVGDPWSDIRQAARQIRALDNTNVRPLSGDGAGTYTPISIHRPGAPAWQGVALDELHGATWRGGRRVAIPKGIHGVTIFEKAS